MNYSFLDIKTPIIPITTDNSIKLIKRYDINVPRNHIAKKISSTYMNLAKLPAILSVNFSDSLGRGGKNLKYNLDNALENIFQIQPKMTIMIKAPTPPKNPPKNVSTSHLISKLSEILKFLKIFFKGFYMFLLHHGF